MKQTPTLRLADDAAGLARAAQILRGGGTVAFATETVYGLGADARNNMAVAQIYAAKGRPSFNPLIVHLPDLAAAQDLCVFDEAALALAAAFWPGALTLVLPLRPGSGISKLVTAGLPTVAVRVPNHAGAQALLRAFGGPIAAPSANLSGKISPTTAAHVLAGLNGRIDAVVDGGACAVGLESTIVRTGMQGATLLREGGVTENQISVCLGVLIARDTTPAEVAAPGQLASHYAPQGQVRLNATQVLPGEVLLGFGAVANARLNLSESGDLVQAAARLFECLHQLDAMGAQNIAVSPIPDNGIGRAINDRLMRAAAPRD